MTATLAIDDLHVALAGRPRVPLLRGVTLAIVPGEVRGLVGESGAGKSMIGRAIFGLLPGRARITRGTVAFDGRDLVAMPDRARRALLGREIALIPQDPMTSLNPVKRIGEQVAGVLRLKLGLSRREARERARDLLADVAIRDPERVLAAYPHELSGGMRQRVLIAIAFSCRPRLVVADEPTTALDATVQRHVLKSLDESVSTLGSSLILISHDLAVVAALCDRVYVMYRGRVVESGSTEDIFNHPSHGYTSELIKSVKSFSDDEPELYVSRYAI